jgi:hypothetical protein
LIAESARAKLPLESHMTPSPPSPSPRRAKEIAVKKTDLRQGKARPRPRSKAAGEDPVDDLLKSPAEEFGRDQPKRPTRR